MPTFCSFGLVVDGTVDGKNNKEEKAWEVADIRIYHFSWKFLQLGCDMHAVVMVVEMEVFLYFQHV